MSHRTTPFSTVLAAVVLAAALVVSAMAGAGAAALTPAVVKKIATKAATKVIKTQAATLSVAHAQSADKLGGFSAGELRTKAYTFTLPTGATRYNTSYTFPGLPQGTYLATFDFIATSANANPTFASCRYFPMSSAGGGSTTGVFLRASASEIITVGGDGITLDCGSSPEMFTVTSGSVTFVPLDSVVSGTSTDIFP